MSGPDAVNIRVLLIDALGLFRASLSRLLASESGFEVTGECGTASEALELLRHGPETEVDVILLDFDLGTEHVGDFIPAARSAGYQGRFLVVSGSVEARSAALVLRLGVSGIFLKSEPPERLVRAIRCVWSDDVWVDRRVIQLLADQVLDRPPRSDVQTSDGRLPDREQKVLLGILGGLSNRKIASNLGVSESSVKNLIQHLFTKAAVRTRSQLVRLALEGSLGTIKNPGKSDTNEESVETPRGGSPSDAPPESRAPSG
jgi:DNA-binding NarL/FixJ family response regulator